MKDLCDVEVPDERSVITYVAEFYYKFSSEGTCHHLDGADWVDKKETGARRVKQFSELIQGTW